jgi:microcin C transport system substrate-binding protein
VSTFDKYNPFTIKGSAGLPVGLMFDSCWPARWTKPATGYGLLAEDVEVAPDGLSATFRCGPRRAFTTATRCWPQDVKHSYDTLMGPHTSPAYKTLLEDVAGVDVLDERTVRYRFKRPTANCRSPWAACRCSAASGAWKTASPSPSTRW